MSLICSPLPLFPGCTCSTCSLKTIECNRLDGASRKKIFRTLCCLNFWYRANYYKAVRVILRIPLIGWAVLDLFKGISGIKKLWHQDFCRRANHELVEHRGFDVNLECSKTERWDFIKFVEYLTFNLHYLEFLGLLVLFHSVKAFEVTQGWENLVSLCVFGFNSWIMSKQGEARVPLFTWFTSCCFISHLFLLTILKSRLKAHHNSKFITLHQWFPHLSEILSCAMKKFKLKFWHCAWCSKFLDFPDYILNSQMYAVGKFNPKTKFF